MESEALTRIRTMREVTSGLDVARQHRPRTTNSLSQSGKRIEPPEPANDRRLSQMLAKERRRFAAHEASVEKSRKRLLKFRDGLAQTIARNQALTELRLELQRERSSRDHGAAANATRPVTEQPADKGGLRRVGLRY
jgi:hypothetical protein